MLATRKDPARGKPDTQRRFGIHGALVGNAPDTVRPEIFSRHRARLLVRVKPVLHYKNRPVKGSKTLSARSLSVAYYFTENAKKLRRLRNIVNTVNHHPLIKPGRQRGKRAAQAVSGISAWVNLGNEAFA